MKHPIFLATLLLTCLLAGCGTGLFTLPIQGTVTSVPETADPLATSSQAAPTPAASQMVKPTTSGRQTLVVWLPPQFDPDGKTIAGDLLKARLESFSSEQPGIRIVVRIKSTSGPGSILDALTAASAAAPGALPDLIALPREDLETAALKGLLTPLDGLTSAQSDPDWYGYARQLGLLQGSTFGLPFAGDALVLLYRPADVGAPPQDWATMADAAVPLAFPAGDPQALFTLALYQGAGGLIQDSQSRPALDADILARVFSLYASGSQAGVFPAWAIQADSDGQIWQAYQEHRTNLAATWISHFLLETPPDTLAAVLPNGGQEPFTLATGWVWALSSSIPEKNLLSVRLAEHLVDSDFLSKWTAAAGYLPPRPSSLAAWSDQSLQGLLNQVVQSAEARPSNDLMGSLGPVLRDSTLLVVRDQRSPEQTARTAAERLKGP